LQRLFLKFGRQAGFSANGIEKIKTDFTAVFKAAPDDDAAVRQCLESLGAYNAKGPTDTHNVVVAIPAGRYVCAA